MTRLTCVATSAAANMSDNARTSLPVLGEAPPTSRREIAAALREHGLPMEARKPGWLRVNVPGGERYQKVTDTLRGSASTPSAPRRTARTWRSAGAAAPRR